MKNKFKIIKENASWIVVCIFIATMAVIGIYTLIEPLVNG